MRSCSNTSPGNSCWPAELIKVRSPQRLQTRSINIKIAAINMTIDEVLSRADPLVSKTVILILPSQMEETRDDHLIRTANSPYDQLSHRPKREYSDRHVEGRGQVLINAARRRVPLIPRVLKPPPPPGHAGPAGTFPPFGSRLRGTASRGCRFGRLLFVYLLNNKAPR